MGPQQAMVQGNKGLRAVFLTTLPFIATACIDGNLSTTGVPGAGNRTTIFYQQAFVGHTHSCALVNGGIALCWGSGDALGDETNESSPTPVRVESFQYFEQLDLSSYSCGITAGLSSGRAWCWGSNEEGRLGNGTTDDQRIPVPVDTPLSFTDITTGGNHTCALSSGQALYCWGSNRFQQLLSHPDTLSLVPVELLHGQKFRDVDAGGIQTCAIDEADAVWCWGGSWGGVPTQVSGAQVFAQFSVGDQHACGLTNNGEAICFGQNTEGQLGNGSFALTSNALPPVAVDTELRFTEISAGSFHTCAITNDGEAYCWGRDDLGQLGDGDRPGDPSRKASPTRVVGTNFVRLTTISAGQFASCAVGDEQVGYCWGFGTGSASQPFSTQAVVIGS